MTSHRVRQVRNKEDGCKSTRAITVIELRGNEKSQDMFDVE